DNEAKAESIKLAHDNHPATSTPRTPPAVREIPATMRSMSALGMARSLLVALSNAAWSGRRVRPGSQRLESSASDLTIRPPLSNETAVFTAFYPLVCKAKTPALRLALRTTLGRSSLVGPRRFQGAVRQHLKLVRTPLGHLVIPVMDRLPAYPECTSERGGVAEILDRVILSHGADCKAYL